MEIDTFTMHLDFEQSATSTQENATGGETGMSVHSGILCGCLSRFSRSASLNFSFSFLLSLHTKGRGRLRSHSADKNNNSNSKARTLPVYNNSGIAGFEAGLEEVTLMVAMRSLCFISV